MTGFLLNGVVLAAALAALFLVSPFNRRLVFSALRSLETHFLRSLLATLGVVIGVGSVVAAMSILEGATSKIIDDFSTLGSNALYVSPAQAHVGGRQVGIAQTLTLDDVARLRRDLPDDLDAVSGEAQGQATVKYFQKSSDYSVLATSEKYFSIHDYNAKSGRVINKIESEDELALVVCLGSKVAEKLFGGVDPVGQTVKIRNAAYRVIAVMEQRGTVGFVNADESVFIPIKSGLKRFFNRKWLTWLTIQVRDREKIDEVKEKVTATLRRSHNIRVGQEDDFRIFTQEEVMRNLNEFSLIFKVVFYSIAGISLVVGGIGIMNIMLVSVTERTREIGVRMAVGARRRDILTQFLVEALIISLLGGGFGLLLGMMFADLLDKVLQGLFATEITSGVVLTALFTTTIVGVLSGLYPAFKASRLDPVVALRYE
jgi:putative ABC transport system permease protein